MIAVCPNPYRDTDLSITRSVIKLVEQEGEKAAFCPIFNDEFDASACEGLTAETLECVAPKCSLAVVIGGDGTMLAAARKVYQYRMPIVGVNLGTKGFMASLEADELGRIPDALHGKCRLSQRMMLDVSLVRDGQVIYRDCALNDVVLRGYVDCIGIQVFSDREQITEFSGDGVILSTPTGSTGYSMSAGGPIVEPEANAILVSPVCAHTMSSRTYVLAPRRTVTAIPGRLHDRKAHLSVDGLYSMDLKNGDEVRVTRSTECTRFVDFGICSFFDTASRKLK